MPLIIGGLVLSSLGELFVMLAYIGCALYGLVTLFQLVTLPTEFNASNRALRTIEDTNLLQGEEFKQAKQVLSAAAMTRSEAVTAVKRATANTFTKQDMVVQFSRETLTLSPKKTGAKLRD